MRKDAARRVDVRTVVYFRRIYLQLRGGVARRVIGLEEAGLLEMLKDIGCHIFLEVKGFNPIV